MPIKSISIEASFSLWTSISNKIHQHGAFVKCVMPEARDLFFVGSLKLGSLAMIEFNLMNRSMTVRTENLNHNIPKGLHQGSSRRFG
jgi:hypothetical protein